MRKLEKRIGNEVVSSLNLYILKNDDAHHDCRPFALIENVRTREGFENRGFASELLKEAIQIAKEAKCYKVVLETSSTAPNVAHLYEKVGFSRNVKTAYYLGLDEDSGYGSLKKSPQSDSVRFSLSFSPISLPRAMMAAFMLKRHSSKSSLLSGRDLPMV